MTIHREISKEFGLPAEQLRKPIHGEILKMFGFAEDTPPEHLVCGLVLVEGYSYGGQRSWSIVARSAHADDSERYNAGDQEAIFGTASFEDDTLAPINPVQAMIEADKWIRTSRSAMFVPDTIRPLPVPPDMQSSVFAGLLLVRATERP